MTDHRADPDFRALMAAVRHAPKDDAPRLILADWLQERDDHWHEFIRWHIRTKLRHMSDGGTLTVDYVPADRPDADGKVWVNRLYRKFVPPDSWYPNAAFSFWKWTWERGFPHRVRLPAEELDSVLPLLLEEWPIREVVTEGGLPPYRIEHKLAHLKLSWYTNVFRYDRCPEMTDEERRRVRAAARELERAKDRAAADRANWHRKMEALT